MIGEAVKNLNPISMKLLKRPNLTEWLFGVVLILTPSLASLIFYLPMLLFRAQLSNALSALQLLLFLIAVAVVPVLVFRWSHFFVRVANRKMLKQYQEM
jgi:hypothetical protein